MKIGIIGLGDIAQKAYLPVMTQLGQVQPVFCTRDPNTLAALSRQYRCEQICQDYKQLLTMNVDAVMIHAATSIHFELASFFLRNGIPTFVDKPLADSAEQVETLYQLAQQHHQPLYVGFNRRHIPLYNQYIPELAQGQVGALRALRWEKHRFDLPGDLRTFIFDDFIHPLDSINLGAKADLQDVYITHQKCGEQLARLDVQWQVSETLLHASMNRQFGITTERVSASYENRALEFDSFVAGCEWQQNTKRQLALKDWTPMLTSKGFDTMIHDWIRVVEQGKLAQSVMERNIASHRLAESVFERVVKQFN
ncbi:Gfo/Idh/MocA family protein [Vibrio sp. NTOU-M3]|uniref:Gfo/Idh/MocA family protein n=1 Tax=Vibrio sp. NTOU-M3 TaxID=3234954 RepID=UPI00349F7682